MQTTLDLRARFAAARDAEENAGSTPVTTPAQPSAAGAPRWLTNGRVELVRKMLAERYPAQEAAERFAAIDWASMTPRGYQAGIDRLKGVPRLDRPVPAAPAEAPKTTASVEGTLPLCEGRFTVEFEDGDHKTLRIRQQDEDAKFMPGRLIVSHLTGPDNTNDYTSVGHVAPNGAIVIWKKHRGNARLAEALRVLAGDPLAAVKAYARMSQHCGFCGLPLTHPTSLDWLYGERCAEKHGLPWG
jgi:hypothetical protein